MDRPTNIDGRRTSIVVYQGESLQLFELVARDLLAVWGLLAKGEETGNMTDAYLRVVSAGAFRDDGSPRWTIKEVEGLPARVVVDLAERILEMSEVNVEPQERENPTEPPSPPSESLP